MGIAEYKLIIRKNVQLLDVFFHTFLDYFLGYLVNARQ